MTVALLTVRQAAQRAGIPRRTLFRWCKARLHIEPELLVRLSVAERAMWRVNPEALARLLGNDVEGLSERVVAQGRRIFDIERKASRLSREVKDLHAKVDLLLAA